MGWFTVRRPVDDRSGADPGGGVRWVREVPGVAPRRTTGPLRNKDDHPRPQRVFAPVHHDAACPRHPDDEHVHLPVYVLAHALSGWEPDQVGVKVFAPVEGPKRAGIPPWGENLPQVNRVRFTHAEILARHRPRRPTDGRSAALGQEGDAPTLYRSARKHENFGPGGRSGISAVARERVHNGRDTWRRALLVA